MFLSVPYSSRMATQELDDIAGASALNGQDLELDPEAVRRGATIRGFRRAYGMTLEELGAIVAKSHGYLSKVETGKAMADVPLCRAIATALDLELAAIVVAPPKPTP